MSDHPRTCEELLRAMVRFNTVNSNISGIPDAEAPLAIWLEALAGRMGLSTKRLPLEGESFNLLICAESKPGRPWLLFESHMDTVSVEGMTIDPFGATIQDGKLFGRGASDTKGSGAAMLWALGRFTKKPAAQRRRNVAVVFVCGEEMEKSGAIPFAERQLPSLGWEIEGIIVGEPTMVQPVVAHNGVVRWPIETHGVACHSSDPTNGKSAISMMVRVIDAIESRYAPSLDASHPLTGPARCSVNLIRGGTQINIIPERCQIEVDRRLVPGEDPATVMPAVQKLLDQVRHENPGLEVTQGKPFIDPALDPSGAGKLIDFVRRTLREMKLSDEPAGVPYGTDASTYCDAGFPTLVLGPGDIRQAHTRDEWIALDQLNRAAEVYLALMEQA